MPATVIVLAYGTGYSKFPFMMEYGDRLVRAGKIAVGGFCLTSALVGCGIFEGQVQGAESNCKIACWGTCPYRREIAEKCGKVRCMARVSGKGRQKDGWQGKASRRKVTLSEQEAIRFLRAEMTSGVVILVDMWQPVCLAGPPFRSRKTLQNLSARMGGGKAAGRSRAGARRSRKRSKHHSDRRQVCCPLSTEVKFSGETWEAEVGEKTPKENVQGKLPAERKADWLQNEKAQGELLWQGK